jgi:hypothetical protein
VVAPIELEEARASSAMVGIPPEQMVCDMPVRVVFENVAENVTLAKFVAAESR